MTVPPDVFFLGLKGMLTLFTLIYYYPLSLEAATGVRARFVLTTFPASCPQEVRMYSCRLRSCQLEAGTPNSVCCLPQQEERQALTEHFFNLALYDSLTSLKVGSLLRKLWLPEQNQLVV